MVECTGKSITHLALEIYEVLDDTLYALAIYKVLHKRTKSIYEREFDYCHRRLWISIQNNNLMIATINWCKVFGSSNNNKTYYKRVLTDDRVFLKMTELKGISIEEYIKELRAFRDKYIAHNDSYNSPVPDFDIALSIMDMFDKAVTEVPELGLLFRNKNLIDTFNDYCEQINQYLDGINVIEI